MKKFNLKALLISLSLTLGTGVIAAIGNMGVMKKYETMYRPALSPPGYAFPIVWTVLYVLMGVSAWLVWETDSGGRLKDKSDALKLTFTLYGIQLFLNGLWSFLFFRGELYFLAFIDILLLWLFVYLTMKQFYQFSPLAARLLIPYLAWITFAGYLNLAVALRTLYV